MKKIIYLVVGLFVAAPAFTSCREDREVEVEELAPDANDSSDDEGYDTNPTPSDPD
ncbi:MAG: hypothetical protein WBA16_01520 [Nonlabens sp.]